MPLPRIFEVEVGSYFHLERGILLPQYFDKGNMPIPYHLNPYQLLARDSLRRAGPGCATGGPKQCDMPCLFVTPHQ